MFCPDADVENVFGFRRFDPDVGPGKIAAKLFLFGGRYLSENLKAGRFIAGQRADGRRRFDALAAVGIRDDDALYIFDDVAAGRDDDAVRQLAQYGSCLLYTSPSPRDRG